MRMVEHPFRNATEGAGRTGPTVTADDDDVRSPRLRPPDDRGVIDYVVDEDLGPISETPRIRSATAWAARAESFAGSSAN